MSDSFSVVSWNVNGIRSAVRQGFMNWLKGCTADVVALQEVRADAAAIPPEIMRLRRWTRNFQAADRKGYSGVGLLSLGKPSSVETSLGIEEFDVEGRCQIARFGALWLVNSYFPNGNGKNRDNSRVPYKLAYYQRLRDTLRPAFDRGEPIVVVGDFNTAHQEIDLARPKQNRKTSGFLDEERAELSEWLKEGWVDSFRSTHPEEEGRYTWWSQRFGVREKNVGWRIDYILLSPGAAPFLKEAAIYSSTKGSDHCPIGVTLDAKVLTL